MGKFCLYGRWRKFPLSSVGPLVCAEGECSANDVASRGPSPPERGGGGAELHGRPHPTPQPSHRGGLAPEGKGVFATEAPQVCGLGGYALCHWERHLCCARVGLRSSADGCCPCPSASLPRRRRRCSTQSQSGGCPPPPAQEMQRTGVGRGRGGGVLSTSFASSTPANNSHALCFSTRPAFRHRVKFVSRSTASRALKSPTAVGRCLWGGAVESDADQRGSLSAVAECTPEGGTSALGTAPFKHRPRGGGGEGGSLEPPKNWGGLGKGINGQGR